MHVQHQPSQHLLNCKIKLISLIILLICTQSAYAQDLTAQEANSIESVTGDTSNSEKKIDVPTVGTQYGATKKTLLSAEVKNTQQAGTGKTASQGKPIGKPVDIELKAVTVRAKRFHEIGPLPGLGLTKEEIPGNVQSISAKEIKESHSLSLTDLLNKKLQSVNVNDYAGNPFQMDVTYRGFTAGPQIGTPQGLSVFLDGIRINEPFGDVVNWDMIPMNAIAGVDVFPGSNPIFGLNTLGGAFTLKTKDGFNNEGVDAEVLTGSFGRKQLQISSGWNNGTVALFGAGNFFLEDGWRQNSPSKVNQLFGKASYRGEKLDLSLSTLLVKTDLVGNGLLPSQMYAQDPTNVFTSPDTTKNKLMQFQLSGAFQVNDNFNITGQVYRRDSKRHQTSGDVFTGIDPEMLARRKPNPGEQYTCLFNNTNPFGYKVPDYYVIPIVAPSGATLPSDIDVALFSSQYMQDYFANGKVLTAADGVTDAFGNIISYDALKNTQLDPGFAKALEEQFAFWVNFNENVIYNRGLPKPSPSGPIQTYFFGSDASFQAGDVELSGVVFAPTPGSNLYYDIPSSFFYTTDPTTHVVTKNYVAFLRPINAQDGDPNNCVNTQATSASHSNNSAAYTYLDAAGYPVFVDGAASGQPGVVDGTPTGILTDNKINQMVDGASVQFNWNLDHHKFMVGASIDAASADYTNSQQLGFLTANRAVYLDPSQANPQFAGAFESISNNNFKGNSITKSLYASETWTPIETLHITTSARYNNTQVKNEIATRHGVAAYSIGDVVAVPAPFDLCPNGDCSNVPVNYRLPRLFNVLDPGETEKFSYNSLNPSLGATWQANENLNLFANWAKGTRTPSVIELGCALDKSSGGQLLDGQGNPLFVDGLPVMLWKSVAENRQCSLPTTLSGDPYLPQIKATTYDVGMRGNFNKLWGAENIQWNLGAYQTDLKDDIYFVSVAGGGGGFFDTIGKTRRRGLEAGLSGRQDKLSFSLNYSLTDATFQDSFLMLSANNSSSVKINGFGDGVIKVDKGNRMPGVPLHNLNASVGYDVTDKWNIGLSAVMHSGSFVRGNENNQHQVGVVKTVQLIVPDGNGGVQVINAQSQPTSNPGTVPGYATFNFQTSYKFNKEWTATMLVNNLFDKEYFSAGRLGVNPFSPSINGAIGPDGYNHNSSDWQSTNFISPGAPRGIWFSLNWQFAPDKK
jgi:Fe(3+) dicitrate transport protein